MSTNHNQQHKRPRTAASDSSDIDMDSVDDQNPNKAMRSNAKPSSSPIICRFPPTCSHRPTQLQSVAEMEQHYAKYHAHVCESPKCDCVFHEARLLELHQTECHDPIAAVRRERGEKIFGCFQPTCERVFLTPKARRLHLIDAHGYRRDFYFSVTVKGIGGLLAQWGEGASLIRGDDLSKKEKPEGTDGTATPKENTPAPKETESQHVSHIVAGMGRGRGRGKQQEVVKKEEYSTRPAPEETRSDAEMNVDELADSMNALNLVPTAIRFGRGGKRSFGGMGTTGGYVKGVHHEDEPPRGRGGFRGGGRGRYDPHFIPGRGRALGSGVRGMSRGRGRILPPS